MLLLFFRVLLLPLPLPALLVSMAPSRHLYASWFLDSMTLVTLFLLLLLFRFLSPLPLMALKARSRACLAQALAPPEAVVEMFLGADVDLGLAVEIAAKVPMDKSESTQIISSSQPPPGARGITPPVVVVAL